MGRVFMTAIDDPFESCSTRSRPCRTRRASSSWTSTRRRRPKKSRWAGISTARATRRGRHAHARADRRRAHPAEGHRVHHRRRHDRPARLGHWRRARGIIQRFLTGLPQRFETATENPRLNGVLVTADEQTGRALSIERLNLSGAQIELWPRAARHRPSTLMSPADDWIGLPFDESIRRNRRSATPHARADGRRPSANSRRN